MEDALPDFDALWNYSRPTETEARFRELLPATDSRPDLYLDFAIAYSELAQDPWLATNEPARLERLRRLSETPGD